MFVSFGYANPLFNQPRGYIMKLNLKLITIKKRWENWNLYGNWNSAWICFHNETKKNVLRRCQFEIKWNLVRMRPTNCRLISHKHIEQRITDSIRKKGVEFYHKCAWNSHFFLFWKKKYIKKSNLTFFSPKQTIKMINSASFQWNRCAHVPPYFT